MASRRVGLDNSSAGQAVTKRPAANASAGLFGATPPVKVEIEEETPAKEEVQKVVSEPKKEEVVEKKEVAPEKPKKESKAKIKEETEEEELIRQTYFLTPTLIESIRILAFKQNTKKNELVRSLLLDAIPGSILAEAKENLEKRNKKK